MSKRTILWFSVCVLALAQLAALASCGSPAGDGETPADLALALSPSYVQGAYTDLSSAATSASVVYAHAQSSGDLNFVSVGWNDATGSVASVTDSAGNAYLPVPHASTAYAPGPASIALYYALPIRSSSSNKVVVTMSQKVDFLEVIAAEYANVASVDTGVADAKSSPPSHSGTLHTAVAGELLVNTNYCGSATTSPAAGFTKRLATSRDSDILEDLIVGPAYNYSATAGLSTGWSVSAMAAFKPAAARDAGPDADAADARRDSSSDGADAARDSGTGWHPDADPPDADPPACTGHLHAAPSGVYLLDGNENPFLIVADASWALPFKLSTAEATGYLTQRWQQGFNLELLTVTGNAYEGGYASWTTYDGVPMFTGTVGGQPDLSTPNPAYFSRVDAAVSTASGLGFQVMLLPLDCNAAGGLPALRANGTAKAHAFGAFLGNRYGGRANVIWHNGVDFQTWTTQADDQLCQAVARGVASVDPCAMQTVELNFTQSSSTDDPTWSPPVNLSWVYDYSPQYDYMLRELSRTARTHMPYLLGEANYEGENNTGNDPSTPLVLRKQDYWGSPLSGGTGSMFGNHYTWQFASGWQNNVATPGAAQYNVAARLFKSIAWQTLVPDSAHAVLTAGSGTYVHTGAASVTLNDYAAAALTTDGATFLAYVPTARTVTVNMAKLTRSSVTAQWFDPVSGAYSNVSGSPFPNAGSRQFTMPGKNSGGDGDWVLVLR
jgi:hypothetical protein